MAIKNKKRHKSQLREIMSRLVKNKLAMVGLIVILLLILLAVLAPVIAPYNFATQDLKLTYAPPSKAHLLGTDKLGRDILSRLIYGTRQSLKIGIFSVAIASVLGTILGSIAGFYGGKIDNILMRLLDIYQSIPGMLLSIALAASLGPGINNAILAIGISTIPAYARIIRASIMTVREKEFIEAAIAINAGDFRIITKHVLPNAISPLIVEITMNIGNSILAAATLSFIGLGAQPPSPEWGAMLVEGRNYMRDYGYLVIYPGICIMASVLSFNVLGDGLRDAMDPRLKN
ncbi:MAG TPA: ABC transporter permease [Epulopiscium sp.]|nr:ABC transporter permease [Candidatus Epulonipiscium sp.]